MKLTRHTYIIYISILKHVKRLSAELSFCFVFTEMASVKCQSLEESLDLSSELPVLIISTNASVIDKSEELNISLIPSREVKKDQLIGSASPAHLLN